MYSDPVLLTVGPTVPPAALDGAGIRPGGLPGGRGGGVAGAVDGALFRPGRLPGGPGGGVGDGVFDVVLWVVQGGHFIIHSDLFVLTV